MKIFTLSPRENWVCDRFSQEWEINNSDISTRNILDSNIVWLLAGWCWNHIPVKILREKIVVITIHHIVPEKFTESKRQEFLFRDQFVDLYHVTCEKSMKQVQEITDKPVFKQRFWANQSLWFEIKDKIELRKKYNLSEKYVIGSFQRDTEGYDLKSPKLEKGPDIFCDLVEDISTNNPNIHILLAGWRRQYVINRLESSKIPYLYLEMPEFDIINELYNCLDLYISSARCEGGPQSIIECALTRTPIVSTDVGIASTILSKKSIFDEMWTATPDVDAASKNVECLKIPLGFSYFRDVFFNLLESQKISSQEKA